MFARMLLLAACSGLLFAQALKPAGAIPLPGVSGRIDHLAIDADGKRLFVAALGNGTIEIIDLAARAVARTIRGVPEPQGLAYAPDLARLFAATGGDGKLRSYDARSWAVLGLADWGGTTPTTSGTTKRPAAFIRATDRAASESSTRGTAASSAISRSAAIRNRSNLKGMVPGSG